MIHPVIAYIFEIYALHIWLKLKAQNVLNSFI